MLLRTNRTNYFSLSSVILSHSPISLCYEASMQPWKVFMGLCLFRSLIIFYFWILIFGYWFQEREESFIDQRRRGKDNIKVRTRGKGNHFRSSCLMLIVLFIIMFIVMLNFNVRHLIFGLMPQIIVYVFNCVVSMWPLSYGVMLQ